METTQLKLYNSKARIKEILTAHLPETPVDGDVFDCPVKGSTASLVFTESDPFELLNTLVNDLNKESKSVTATNSIAAQASGYGGLKLIEFLQGCIVLTPSVWSSIIPQLSNELDIQHCCLNGCCISLSEGTSFIASKNSLIIESTGNGYWVGIYDSNLVIPLTVS